MTFSVKAQAKEVIPAHTSKGKSEAGALRLQQGQEDEHKLDEGEHRVRAFRAFQSGNYKYGSSKIGKKGLFASSSVNRPVAGPLSTNMFLRFETSNIHGCSVGKIIPFRHAERSIRSGKRFCAITLDMLLDWEIPSVPREAATGYGDSLLVPDVATFGWIRWAKGTTARVICDVVTHPCPRSLCKAALSKLYKEFGLEFTTGTEYEFQVLKKDEEGAWEPAWDNKDIFSMREMNQKMDLFSDIDQLLPLGVDVNTYHTEYADGQIEIALEPATGIKAPDACFTFKNGVKELFDKRGLLATFCTKPFGAAQPGCANGGHLNMSLWKTEAADDKGGKRRVNVFCGSGDKRISDQCRWFIGGLMKHCNAISAIVNPTDVCHTRLVDGSWAPSKNCWGFENRTVLVRAKAPNVDSVGFGDVTSSGTYIELRLPGASANPYLAHTAVLAAGMDGMRNKLDPKKPVEADAYKMDFPQTPRDLPEALKAFKANKVMLEAFGEEMHAKFINIKEQELAALARSDSETKHFDMYVKNA